VNEFKFRSSTLSYNHVMERTNALPCHACWKTADSRATRWIVTVVLGSARRRREFCRVLQWRATRYASALKQS